MPGSVAEQEPRRVTDLIHVGSVGWRQANASNGVDGLTKACLAALIESPRQESTKRHKRASLLEPGPVLIELASHNQPESLKNLLVT